LISSLTAPDLVELFFKIHDPTQLDYQGPDVGSQYRTVIFFHNEKQKKIAQEIKERFQDKFKNKIVTDIDPAKEFYKAEEYHQDYLDKK